MDDYSGKRAGDRFIVSRKGSPHVLRDTANNRDQNAQFCNRIGCSGRLNSSKSKPRNFLQEPRKKFSSQLEAESSETGSGQDEPEVTPPSGRIKLDLRPEIDGAGSSDVTSMEAGSSDISTSTRSRWSFHQKSGSGNPVSLASKSTVQGTRLNASRHGPGNLRCNTVSDTASLGSSSSDLNLSRRKDTVNKRICDGESELELGTLNRDSTSASIRTQRPHGGYTRARVANQGSGNNLSANEIPLTSRPDLSLDLNAPSSSRHFSVEASLGRPSSYSRHSSSNGSLRGIRPSSSAEVSNTQSLTNHESFQRYNMAGIAEVLLALERLEQDEELTYEQLLVLETSLVL
ncbi:hypothetical protein OIU84_000051, partial [Salix udensis]